MSEVKKRSLTQRGSSLALELALKSYMCLRTRILTVPWLENHDVLRNVCFRDNDVKSEVQHEIIVVAALE